MIFWDRKSQNRFFFKFFITKSPDFISNLNDNCSQLSFEVYNVCVAQKLRISEFLINFLSPGTWQLRRPPEAAISTSATSNGYQILAEYVDIYMRYSFSAIVLSFDLFEGLIVKGIFLYKIPVEKVLHPSIKSTLYTGTPTSQIIVF